MSSIWVSIGLFLACCATTWMVGGPYFAGTLMGILLCHELGHYVIGRRRGAEVSLPYFIPLPPFISLGTLGAVIRMRTPITDRNILFDVGAAGPIAGLVVAIPLLVLGLSMSELEPMKTGNTQEGNSILYLLIKYAMFGTWLPGNGVDVSIHPMAEGAWVGLLVTAINLMPIGQLDGGHIAKAALGDRHERLSARLNIVLPIVGVCIGSVMFVTALDAGRDAWGAVGYASSGLVPWCLWGVLLGLMRRQAGEYHPAVSEAPLTPGRRLAAIGMAVLFVLIVTPVPFRPVL